jgi:hypothetical protein
MSPLPRRGWQCVRWVFGPRVLGVATHQLASQGGVVSLPETVELGGDLDRSLARGQQVQDQRDAPVAQPGRPCHAEEVLDT